MVIKDQAFSLDTSKPPNFLGHPIPFTIGWIILITAVVAPLAIRTFRARTAD